MLIMSDLNSAVKVAPVVSHKNPCVRNCCLNEQDVCLGCGRTLMEITGWTRLTDDERERVLMDAEKRKQECATDLFPYY